MTFDVAIVGGSFAGLSAALPLHARGGASPSSTVACGATASPPPPTGFWRRMAARLWQSWRMRAQLAAYPTVRWFEGAVTTVSGSVDAFAVQAGNAVQHARRIILAMGVADALPAIPGLAERWGRTVFHCPYCHGYELQLGRVGLIATGPVSFHRAQLLPEWGRVTFFLNGALSLTEDEGRMLAARGVTVDATPISGVVDEARVVLTDGRSESFAGLFTASRTTPASALAAQLGCEHEEGMLGPFVRTDAMKATSVPGVFACGDLARAMGNVAMAVGDGSLAGTAAHASPVFQH